jgi:hypothetical protein
MSREEDPDDVPFRDGEAERRATAALVVGGVITSQSSEADARKALQANFLTWAAERGFVREGSHLARTTDGVRVLVPLYEVSPETALVQASTARQPVRLSMTIGPVTWSHRLAGKLGVGRRLTEDPVFDAAWHVAASDAGLARQLVDARARAALDGAAGTTATYRDGAIEVRVGAPRLSGAHVLRGVEIAVALGCAQVTSAAYR